MLPREGFDPPTLGLWAPHASSAPPRYMYVVLYFLYKGLIYLKPLLIGYLSI